MKGYLDTRVQGTITPNSWHVEVTHGTANRTLITETVPRPPGPRAEHSKPQVSTYNTGISHKRVPPVPFPVQGGQCAREGSGRCSTCLAPATHLRDPDGGSCCSLAQPQPPQSFGKRTDSWSFPMSFYLSNKQFFSRFKTVNFILPMFYHNRKNTNHLHQLPFNYLPNYLRSNHFF